ncbi:MAG: hypothetical protein ACLFTV_15005 [Desulfococcaceae bacterium]
MIPPERQQIIEFFLNLYRHQMRAVKRPAQYREVEGASGPGAEAIYELRLKQEDGWRTRRMSLGPLAEESGSKSRCYKVIYDELLVVKLPPRPVENFDRYLEHLRREQEIAARLSPEVACITPSVSAILRKLPDFAAGVGGPPEAFEARCLERLRLAPEFQRHLQIGGRFAFFMSLSRNAFLGSVIGEMHDLRSRLAAEILGQGEVIDNPVRFEEVYGRDALGGFFDLQEALSEYDARMAERVNAWGLAEDIPVFRRRQWFLGALAERRADPSADGVPDDRVGAVDALLDEVMESHRPVLDRYRSALRVHVFYRLLGRNRTAMAGLIANLLELLSILREKGVAMRDLKPDNVFLAGDASISPAMLSVPGNYAIGLIDFETAVDFHPESGAIAQPMLAGTPSYATPAHLFRNDLLVSLFGDLSRVLHLQDWQAVTSMIFNVVTGRRLARETGRLIPEIMKIIRQSFRKNLSRPEVFKICSRVFWFNAAAEFRKKLKTYRPVLQDVRVEIPFRARKMLREELMFLRSEGVKRMRRLILGQGLFRSEESLRSLMRATPEAVAQYRRTWEAGGGSSRVSPEVREQLLDVLRTLERYKVEQVRRTEIIDRLELRRPMLTAFQLLEIMFNVVLNAMYRPEWGRLAEDVGDIRLDEARKPGATVISYEDTIVVEESLHQLDGV